MKTLFKWFVIIHAIVLIPFHHLYLFAVACEYLRHGNNPNGYSLFGYLVEVAIVLSGDGVLLLLLVLVIWIRHVRSHQLTPSTNSGSHPSAAIFCLRAKRSLSFSSR